MSESYIQLASTATNNRSATVQIICDSTTNEPRRLVVNDGYKTATVILDEVAVRRIVDALTGAE